MSFTEYLNSAARDPLLTHEEELICGRHIQEMLPLLDKPESELTAANRRTIKRGQRAKDRLIRGNVKLVVSAAKKYAHKQVLRHLSLEDLCQEGLIGLISATTKFDPTRGYKFSTYSYWWIRQAIGRSIQNQERTIRVPVNMLDSISKVNKYIGRIQEEEGRTPNIDECARICGVAEHILRAALMAYKRTASSDAHVHGDADNSTVIELQADERDQDAKETAEWMASWDVLKPHLISLTEKQRECLLDFYGLDGRTERSLRTISQECGKQREVVRQRLISAERKLAKRMQLQVA